MIKAKLIAVLFSAALLVVSSQQTDQNPFTLHDSAHCQKPPETLAWAGKTESPQIQFKPDESASETNRELQPLTREVNLAPELEKELPEKKLPLQGLFETTMEAVLADGKLRLSFSLQNISEQHQQIVIGSGQRYEIWANNEQGDEVYRWSADKAFTDALIELEMEESGQFAFEEVWDLTDYQGQPAPAGTYIIKVKVMAGLKSGAVHQDELEAEAVVEL